jgi:hypothetical protein
LTAEKLQNAWVLSLSPVADFDFYRILGFDFGGEERLIIMAIFLIQIHYLFALFC